MRIEKIIATVLYEAHGRQVEEIMQTFGEGPKSFYKSPQDCGKKGRGTSWLRLFFYAPGRHAAKALRGLCR